VYCGGRALVATFKIEPTSRYGGLVSFTKTFIIAFETGGKPYALRFESGIKRTRTETFYRHTTYAIPVPRP
jgi:hypothetical protein